MSKGYVCPECGLDYDSIAPKDTAVAIRSYPRRLKALVAPIDRDQATRPDAKIRRRPDPHTWSALEYTAHVADIFDTFADIIRRMRIEDRPAIDFFDPDERAVEARYNEQDPDDVLRRLQENAERLAAELDEVAADDWRRTAEFPWGERDLLTMARNAVHEGHHHLRDVERVLGAVKTISDPASTRDL